MGTLIVLLVVAFQAPASEPNASESPQKEARPQYAIANATPEDALRNFIIAMFIQDVAALRAITLPTDPAEFKWLVGGQPIPPDQLEEIKAQMKRVPIRVLKPGETVTLSRDRKVTVRPEEVGADRAILLPEGAPMPTRLRKIEGRWRVDPTPIIAARKAADAARKKAEEELQKSQ